LSLRLAAIFQVPVEQLFQLEETDWSWLKKPRSNRVKCYHKGKNFFCDMLQYVIGLI
jgi:hypothetical protein